MKASIVSKTFLKSVTFVVFTVFFLCCFHMAHAEEQEKRPNIGHPAILDPVARLVSSDHVFHYNARIYQEKQLNDVYLLYKDTAKELVKMLKDAVKNHRDDRSYLSPLHVAIQAVGHWHIYSETDTLLSLLDYRLDETTVPKANYVGAFFFPAALALRDFEIEQAKIVKCITAAETNEKIALLTWLLCLRWSPKEEGIQKATEFIKHEFPKYQRNPRKKEKLETALGMLAKAKYPQFITDALKK